MLGPLPETFSACAYGATAMLSLRGDSQGFATPSSPGCRICSPCAALAEFSATPSGLRCRICSLCAAPAGLCFARGPGMPHLPALLVTPSSLRCRICSPCAALALIFCHALRRGALGALGYVFATPSGLGCRMCAPRVVHAGFPAERGADRRVRKRTGVTPACDRSGNTVAARGRCWSCAPRRRGARKKQCSVLERFFKFCMTPEAGSAK